MEKPERRTFARKTLKWGGALSLLAMINVPKAFGQMKMGNPLKVVPEHPFLQRDDLSYALKSLYMTYDSTSPYPHKFNDVISKGQLECFNFFLLKDLDKDYTEHYVSTMRPVLQRIKKQVEKDGPEHALVGMFEGTSCAYQLFERIEVKPGERIFPCPYKPALENCKKWLPGTFTIEWKDVCTRWCTPVWTGFSNEMGVKISIHPGETCSVKLA